MDKPIFIVLIIAIVLLMVIIGVLYYQLKSNSGVQYSDDNTNQKLRRAKPDLNALTTTSNPLLEAKQMIKSGRLADAQNFLSQQISQAPNRSDLRLLQLAVFAKNNNSHAFETAFDALGRLGDEQALAKANQMRARMTPTENELPMEQMLAQSQANVSSRQTPDLAKAETLDDEFPTLDAQDSFGADVADDGAADNEIDLDTSDDNEVPELSLGDELNFDSDFEESSSFSKADLSSTGTFEALETELNNDSIEFDAVQDDAVSTKPAAQSDTNNADFEDDFVSLDFDDDNTNSSDEISFDFEQSPDDQLNDLEDSLTNHEFQPITHDEFVENQTLNMLAVDTSDDKSSTQDDDAVEFSFDDSDFSDSSFTESPVEEPVKSKSDTEGFADLDLSLDLLNETDQSKTSSLETSDEIDSESSNIKIEAGMAKAEDPNLSFDISDFASDTKKEDNFEKFAFDSKDNAVSILDNTDNTDSFSSISSALDDGLEEPVQPQSSMTESNDLVSSFDELDFDEPAHDLSVDLAEEQSSKQKPADKSSIEFNVDDEFGIDFDEPTKSDTTAKPEITEESSTLSELDDFFSENDMDESVSRLDTQPDSQQHSLHTNDLTRRPNEAVNTNNGAVASGLAAAAAAGTAVAGMSLTAKGNKQTASEDSIEQPAISLADVDEFFDGADEANTELQSVDFTADALAPNSTASDIDNQPLGTSANDLAKAEISDTSLEGKNAQAKEVDFDFDTFEDDKEDVELGDADDIQENTDIASSAAQDDGEKLGSMELEENTQLLDQLKSEFSMMASVDTNKVNLDLAKTYMELGEQSSAKSLLKEVLTDGSVEQKTEAERLMLEFGSLSGS